MWTIALDKKSVHDSTTVLDNVMFCNYFPVWCHVFKWPFVLVRKIRHRYAWNMDERWWEEVVGTWCCIHQHYTASLGLASTCIACTFSNVLHFFWGWHIRLTWTDPTKARSHSRRAADDCLGNGGIREDRRKRRQAAISNPCFRSDCLAH